MILQRFTYICALTGSVFFYALYPHWFSGYLLLVVALLAPLDFALGLPGMRNRRFTITAPNLLEQGAEGKLALIAQMPGRYPGGRVKARIRETVDGEMRSHRLVCGAGQPNRREIPISTKHGRVVTYETARVATVSLFGLFSLPVKAERRITVVVLPTPKRPPNITALPRGVVFRPKPGGGFSEDYDIRPYRQGDPVRSVHWKVSAKVNELMVREPLIPPPHSRLIETARWKSNDERDLILGRLRWMSDYLLKWEMPFYLKIGEDGVVTEIVDAGGLAACLVHALGGTEKAIAACPATPAGFAWVFKIDAREEGAASERRRASAKAARGGGDGAHVDDASEIAMGGMEPTV